MSILLFPVIGRCHNHLGALLLNSSWSKTQNCRWNFDAICHSSRDISISGLGGHIAISGCRSLLLSFGDTFFDVAVVGELDFVTWITTILRQAILDQFCHISQHDHKISPVSKNSHVSDVMPNNFWCTDWRPVCCICTHFIFRKSHERTAPNAEQKFFIDSKTELEAFLAPSAIRGLKCNTFSFNDNRSKQQFKLRYT